MKEESCMESSVVQFSGGGAQPIGDLFVYNFGVFQGFDFTASTDKIDVYGLSVSLQWRNSANDSVPVLAWSVNVRMFGQTPTGGFELLGGPAQISRSIILDSANPIWKSHSPFTNAERAELFDVYMHIPPFDYAAFGFGFSNFTLFGQLTVHFKRN